MKKFGMLMLMLSLVGYAVGCGGTKEESTPATPAPPADTGAADDAGTTE